MVHKPYKVMGPENIDHPKENADESSIYAASWALATHEIKMD